MSYATTTIVGQLAQDPDVKEVNNKRVAEFTVPVNTGKDQTTWYRVAVWGTGADHVMNYFKKGDSIALTGQISVRSYKTKDGEARAELKLTVFGFPGFVGGGKKKSEKSEDEDIF